MFEHLEFYAGYEQAVQCTGMPFFQVPGNHDVDNAAMTDETSVETFTRRLASAAATGNW